MIEEFVRHMPFEAARQGQTGDVLWYQLQAREAADLWVALDLVDMRFASLRYHEVLAVLFVREYDPDGSDILWRFEYASRRPPQVAWTGHRPIHERIPSQASIRESIPETIRVLLDALEIELVPMFELAAEPTDE